MVRTRNFGWLSAFAALALLLLALSPLPLAGDIEARGAALVAPASQAVRDATRPLADIVLHAGQLTELTEENAELRRSVERLEGEAVALREANALAEQSAALGSAAGGAVVRHVTAPVLVRDPAPGRHVIVVGRGASDGVAVGQPVLGPGGTLVGIVVEVEPRQARVRLLDDPASAVAAVLQQTRTAGALTGSDEGLRLEYVRTGEQVGVGDVVMSSPLGGRLPAGLLIGRVASVEGRPQALFQSIRVEPLGDYRRLEHVLILTERPPSEASPS